MMLDRIRSTPTRPLAVALMVVMVVVAFAGLAISRSDRDDDRPTTTQALSEAPPDVPSAPSRPGLSEDESRPDPLPAIPETPEQSRRTRQQDQPDDDFNRGAEDQAKRWPALQAVPYRRAGVLIDRLDVDPKRPKYLRLLVVSTLSEPEARAIYDQFLRGLKDTGRWYRIAFVTPDRARELGYTG